MVKESIYKAIFVLFLITQILFPYVELITILSFVISFALLIEKRVHIPKALFQVLFIFGILLLIGVVVSLFKSYELYNTARDVIHFSKPLLLILAGFLIVRKINDTSFLPKAIVYMSIVFAIKHLIVIGTATYTRGTIEELRLIAGSGNFIEGLALVLLVGYYKKKLLNITERTKAIFIAILSISIFFYFSRTILIGLFIFFLSIYGYTFLNRKAFEYSTLGLVILGISFGYLATLDLDPDAKGIENFFYKIKNAPAEVFISPEDYDPRNHKQIFNHWRGYEAKMALDQMSENKSSFVMGKGLGALVDLGFKAPIGGVDGLRYITHLHNGYVYILFKTGVVGVLFYLLIILNLYKRGYVKASNFDARFFNRLISGLGLYFFVTTFVVAGLYNLKEHSIFLLGCLFALSSQFEKKKISE